MIHFPTIEGRESMPVRKSVVDPCTLNNSAFSHQWMGINGLHIKKALQVFLKYVDLTSSLVATSGASLAVVAAFLGLASFGVVGDVRLPCRAENKQVRFI